MFIFNIDEKFKNLNSNYAVFIFFISLATIEDDEIEDKKHIIHYILKNNDNNRYKDAIKIANKTIINKKQLINLLKCDFPENMKDLYDIKQAVSKQIEYNTGSRVQFYDHNKKNFQVSLIQVFDRFGEIYYGYTQQEWMVNETLITTNKISNILIKEQKEKTNNIKILKNIVDQFSETISTIKNHIELETENENKTTVIKEKGVDLIFFWAWLIDNVNF